MIKKLEVTLTEHMLPTLMFILGWRSVKNIEKGQGRPNILNNRHVTWTINPFGIGMVDCSCGNLTSWLLFCPWDYTSYRMWPYQLWEIFPAETSSLIELYVEHHGQWSKYAYLRSSESELVRFALFLLGVTFQSNFSFRFRVVSRGSFNELRWRFFFRLLLVLVPCW